MTVRNAIEKQNTPATVTPAQAIKQTVDNYLPVIARALPAHMTPERFASTILTACRKTPELMRCDPVSVVGAAIQAAQLGLEPNDGRGLCSIIPRGGKATFQMEYRGMVELGRRSGLIARTVARTVYEGDEFHYSYGTADEGIVHKPTTGERGKSYLWYAIAWGPDGALLDFVVLTRADVEYHRSFSSQPNGATWTKSYDAMARKTAVRELYRMLPQSPEMARAQAADDRTFHVGVDEFEPDEVSEREVVHIGAVEAEEVVEGTLLEVSDG